MEKEKKIAENIADMLNDFCVNEAKICKEMKREHRTIQQNFTRLCLEWLKTCASDEYTYDGRNEASHIVAKELLQGHEDLALPFI